MRKLIVLAILMLSTAAFAQTNTNVISRIRDATDQTQVAAVNVGGAIIAATTPALTTRTLVYGYDSAADNRWERVDLGSGVAAAGLRCAPTTDAYTMVSKTTAVNSVTNGLWMELTDGAAAFLDNTSSPGYFRFQDGDSTTLVDVETDQADGKATTLNSAVTSSVQYLYNGATLDMARSGASGGLLVEVVTRAWEDLANGWVNTKKSAIGTYAPAKTSTANVGTAAVVVLASTEIYGYESCTIYLRNTDAADAFVSVEAYTSPDNAGTCGDANWVALSWTTCDTLAATNTCLFSITNNSNRYVCVKVAALDANQVSVDAWIVCNVG